MASSNQWGYSYKRGPVWPFLAATSLLQSMLTAALMSPLTAAMVAETSHSTVVTRLAAAFKVVEREGRAGGALV